MSLPAGAKGGGPVEHRAGRKSRGTKDVQRGQRGCEGTRGQRGGEVVAVDGDIGAGRWSAGCRSAGGGLPERREHGPSKEGGWDELMLAGTLERSI